MTIPSVNTGQGYVSVQPVYLLDSSGIPIVISSGSVTADNGVVLPLDSLAHTFTSSGGLITTDTVVYLGVTYVQTLTYSGGVIQTISQWVAQ